MNIVRKEWKRPFFDFTLFQDCYAKITFRQLSHRKNLYKYSVFVTDPDGGDVTFKFRELLAGIAEQFIDSRFFLQFADLWLLMPVTKTMISLLKTRLHLLCFRLRS